MRPAGYTLIELLVVISIIAILAVAGFVNFKSFSQSKVTEKAAGQMQTILRLAQSNATSSTLCPDPGVSDQGAKAWHLVMASNTTINLTCDTATTTDYLHKSYTLENARIEGIAGQRPGFGFCAVDLAVTPFKITYSTGAGALTASPCATSDFWDFNVRNTVDTTSVKSMRLIRGGSIYVQ